LDHSNLALLTEQEIVDALNKLGAIKRAELKMIEYREKLAQERGVTQLSVSDFKNEKLMILDASAMNWMPIYDRLLSYFASDASCGLDLNKGILISGNVGTGKTELMKLFAVNPNCPFRVIGCRDVAKDFMANGMDSMIPYRSLIKNLHRDKPIFGNGEWFGICFDDMGTESSAKNFGNNLNVMAEIIQDRYDLKNHKYTHITTNMNADEIANVYGDRVQSRMAEMFNIIDIGVESIDLRRI
jgi:DNA replication protein DnaC